MHDEHLIKNKQNITRSLKKMMSMVDLQYVHMCDYGIPFMGNFGHKSDTMSPGMAEWVTEWQNG